MDIIELKNQISSANKAYRSGNPTMSDQAWDDLLESLQKQIPEDEFDAFRATLHEVKGKVKHPFVMGSLDKLKFEEPAEVEKFIKTYSRNALNVSAKVDGISCRLHYEGGKLVSASTRGDGFYGEDLTDKIKHVKFIPAEVDMMKLVASEVDVRGELVILKDDFAKMSGFANPRNAVAGLMGRKDWKADDMSHVSFIAYTILGDGFTKSGQFKTLKLWGFKTAWNTEIERPYSKIVDELFELASQEFDYETDGLVLSSNDYINENVYRPEKQKAFKINQQKAITRLIDIDWASPSKNGVFCPVAILDPIELGGAIITKASLYNIEYLEKLNLDFGDKVEVIRSGDVIPKITRVVEKYKK